MEPSRGLSKRSLRLLSPVIVFLETVLACWLGLFADGMRLPSWRDFAFLLSHCAPGIFLAVMVAIGQSFFGVKVRNIIIVGTIAALCIGGYTYLLILAWASC